MTITKFSLKQIPIVPKPRGQLNKYGKMTHALNGYGQWKKDCIRIINASDLQILPGYFGFVYHLKIKPKCGQQPDCSNLIGSFEDALVKSGRLKDDNWRVIPYFAVFASESTELPFSQLDFYQVDSLPEFFRCILIVLASKLKIKIFN